MSIKKSSLEGKWYYRVLKVLLLILPLIFILIFLLNGKVVVCNVLQKDVLNFLQRYFVYLTIGLVLYYLILEIIWRSFLYIVFGGVVDDTKKGEVEQQSEGRKSNKMASLIPLIIILVVIAMAVLSRMGYITLPKINIGSFENSNTGTVTPKPTSKPSCPTTSAQTGTPCHSVKNGVGVSGVIVSAKCKCPNDTTYAQTDNITAGGPYNICTCN
ncbi:MAG: hypothetical protein NT162_03080 [Candidatus Woesebacteria bacterium]|nr:hypothetical protein [Candidatus Woesebacteria bacterium]